MLRRTAERQAEDDLTIHGCPDCQFARGEESAEDELHDADERDRIQIF
jgi:hypothetical protein